MLLRGAGVTTDGAAISVPIGVMHSRVSLTVDLRLAFPADAFLTSAPRPHVLGDLANRLQRGHRRVGDDRVLDIVDRQHGDTGGSP